MKSLRWISLVTTLLLAQVATTFASVNPQGFDPQMSHQQMPPPVIQLQPCHVLWFGGDGPDEILRFTGLGLVITQTNNPADLNPANLAAYDVLVVAYTGPGVIGANQPAIAAFVAADNGLLIHQPNTAGAIDYAPAGFGLTIADICWCGICNTSMFDATIVNGAQPVTSGLVDADLAGDFDTAAGLGGSYTLLARNVNCPNNPSLAAGVFGTGRVVFETGNASPLAFDFGSDAYWAHLFEWLCIGSTTPTNADTWGRLKVLYR